MKNIILASIMAFGICGTAFAADPVKSDRTDFYIGGSIGTSTDDKSRINIGIDAGVQLGSYFRVEADVDRAWRTDGKDGYRVTLNGIGQYRIPNSVVTPYVIAGGGYALDGTAIWNVGAGTRIALSQAVELDLRYREVRPFEDRKTALKQDHVFTTGLNYRF
jgi:opacity protein-like surface antigen